MDDRNSKVPNCIDQNEPYISGAKWFKPWTCIDSNLGFFESSAAKCKRLPRHPPESADFDSAPACIDSNLGENTLKTKGNRRLYAKNRSWSIQTWHLHRFQPCTCIDFNLVCRWFTLSFPWIKKGAPWFFDSALDGIDFNLGLKTFKNKGKWSIWFRYVCQKTSPEIW